MPKPMPVKGAPSNNTIQNKQESLLMQVHAAFLRSLRDKKLADIAT